MSYPSSLDSIATVSSGNLIQSSYVNSQTNAINAIESTLSLNPSRAIVEGRLTLTTAVPITTSDVTGATTIYFTPFRGNRIALYDGSSTWNLYTLSGDISVALGTLTNNTVYDVFCYNNSGTPALEIGPAWSNSGAGSSARATALVLQNGVLVKSGATTRRYLGSFRTTSTTTTEDSAANRVLYNFYNQVPRHAIAQTNTSPTFTSASWTAVGSTILSFLNGYQLGSVQYAAFANGASHSAGNTLSSFGAGLNGSNPAITAYTSTHAAVANDDYNSTAPTVGGYPVLGYNTVQAYAQTAASTLTLINPAATATVMM